MAVPSSRNAPRLLGLLAALTTAAALAYVLPAYSILRRMVERRDNLSLGSLQLTGTASFAPGVASAALASPGDKETQADATVSLRVPGRCRAEVNVPEGASSASVASQGRKRVDGTEIPALSAAVTEACALVAIRSGAQKGDARTGVEEHLRRLGIDTRQTSLSRFDGHIVYVIGNPADGAPQFWIYKDTFLPARVLYADNTGKWDVRFRDFGSPVAGDWFPRILEVWKDGQQALKFTALQANANARLGDQLF